MRSFFRYWIPVMAWGFLIFCFSTDQFSASNTSRIIGPLLHWLHPGLSLEMEATIHFLIRKLGHWTEYFIFAALLLRALARTDNARWNYRMAMLAVLLVFLLACSDEFHQYFVPSRTPSARDSLLDLLGGTCGVLWIYRKHLRAIRHESHGC
jgi:VanZ family protein